MCHSILYASPYLVCACLFCMLPPHFVYGRLILQAPLYLFPMLTHFFLHRCPSQYAPPYFVCQRHISCVEAPIYFVCTTLIHMSKPYFVLYLSTFAYIRSICKFRLYIKNMYLSLPCLLNATLFCLLTSYFICAALFPMSKSRGQSRHYVTTGYQQSKLNL